MQSWKKLQTWIETGDLIPLLILVSVAHYVDVLRARDWVLVAAAIGVLVDLGQYRLLKAALRHGGAWWIPSVVMTVIAFGYHFAFYSLAGADWLEASLLAVPIPFLIIFLAALSVRERWAARVKPNEPNTERSVTVRPEQLPNEPNAPVRAKRGEAKSRIIAEHAVNPLLSVTELAALCGASKAHVSEVLSAQREIGFKAERGTK